MAKRGTLEHPKTMNLARRLGIMPPYALGVLEALWAWVAKYAPTGDVTEADPTLLARSIHYRANPAKLWQALRDTRFLDETTVPGRTLIRDWSEHADDAVRKRLKYHGNTFADGSGPYARKYTDSRENLTPISRENSREKTNSRENLAPTSQENSREETNSRENLAPISCLPGPEPAPEPVPAQKQKQKQKQKPGADMPALPADPPDPAARDEEIPEASSEKQYGYYVCEAAGIAAGDLLRRKMGNAIAMLGREEECDMHTAANRMLERVREAQRSGVYKWLQWLEEGGWREFKLHVEDEL